ncbi:MAG: 50S ribosomal protein L15 [Pseudomonadota bacterium]
MKLNELSPADGSTKARVRVGRGVGSGKGKTGGRGVKGQKSRSGVAINGFEGGQMPIYMRLPKRGFTARNSKTHTWLNLSILSKAIEAGKLDVKQEITEEVLVASGVIRRVRDGVRLLAKGSAPKKVNITVTGASKAAIEAIEKAGGKVTLTGPVKEEASE